MLLIVPPVAWSKCSKLSDFLRNLGNFYSLLKLACDSALKLNINYTKAENIFGAALLAHTHSFQLLFTPDICKKALVFTSLCCMLIFAHSFF